MSKPIIVVAGATGAQGGSVVRALLRSGKYHIRGICRDCNSSEAQELKNKGVELMKCDFTNCGELCNALKGAHTFFALTNFWDPQQMGKEEQIGRQMVDCAKKSGVKHFIWSWLPDVERISKGKHKVPHFTHKARVGEYALQQLPTTLVGPSFYYQNFNTLFSPKKENDGTLVYTLPQTKTITAFDVEDLGEVVCRIACNRDEWIGKTIPLAVEEMHPQRFIDQMTEVTGQRVKLNMIPREEFMKLNVHGGREIVEMFGWFDEYGCFGPHGNNLELGRKLHPNMRTFKQYLQTSKITPK
jgi:uncharacterized protein YbjT (DUF2867 family)